MIIRTAATWLLAAIAGIAAAQDEPAPDAGGEAAAAPAVESIPLPGPGLAEPETPAMLDDVVVTAQKRRQTLQETPISVEAFNEDALIQRGIDGIEDLAANVPSMTVAPFPTDAATLLIFIRGIGLTDAQITQDPPIGIYQDGVYIARSAGLALDLADLERIEVLRGPQGTLYGRNTTGGAINLITRRASTGGFTMSHKLRLGSRDPLNWRSSVNVPLGDALAVKLAVLGNRRDGFVDNTGPGGDFGEHRDQGVRLDASWMPLDVLNVDYAFDQSRLSYYNTMYQAVLPPESDHGQAESFKRYAQRNTVYSDQRLDALASGPPFEASTAHIDGHTATFTGALGDYELKYLVGWRRLYEANYADLGGGLGSTEFRLDSHVYDGPAADLANGGPTPLVIPALTQRQWSHELQVSGDLLEGGVRFIGGVFWFNEKATEDRNRLNHQFSSVLDPEQLGGITSRLPPDVAAEVMDTAAPRVVNLVRFRRDIDNTSTALFGQATWTPELLEQRLHLTLGFRHSQDRREAVKTQISDTYVEYESGGAPTATPLQSAEPFDNVRARLASRDNSLSYIGAFDLTDSVNLYVKSDEAYRSGGFNTRDPQVSGDSGPASDGVDYGFGFVEGFAPEHVQSYEAGIKSEWLGRRLRLNADVFQTSYRDMQINSLIAGTIADTKTHNAGRARMQGLETDASVLLLRGLLLSANYAYLDARVLEVRDVEGNNVADDYPFTSAPRHSGTAALDWTALQSSWGDLRAWLGYSYVGARAGRGLPGKKGLSALPAFDLFNARLSWAGVPIGRGTLDLALWGKNLADRDYVVSAVDNLPQADRAVLWGEPRALGLDFTYRYF